MTREEMIARLEEWRHQQCLNGNQEILTNLPSRNSWEKEFERYEKCLAEQEEKKEEQSETTTLPFAFNLELSAEVKAKFEEQDKLYAEQVAKEGARVRKQYGEVTDHEVIKILKAEKEIAKCKGCQGFPCRKEERKCCTPLITNINNFLLIDYENACGYKKAQRVKEKYGLANIPAEYIGKTFDDYKVDGFNQAAVMTVKTLIEKPNNGVYLYGTVGTGKTLLAAIMAQEIIRLGREVAFATVPTISMQIRSTFNNNSELTESKILEKLYTIPTLVLDDIGMEKPSRYVCSMIANVFNERYNARRQTIMTSNYTLEQLEYIFNNPTDSREKTLDGTRIVDRCKQMCFPIELKGNSRR